MKLIVAIVHDEDVGELIEELTKESYRVTKLSTTGGFLRMGNTTLLIGIEDDQLDNVIEIIKEKCACRREITTSPAPLTGLTGVYIPHPIEVTMGGATIFVVDVDKYLKI